MFVSNCTSSLLKFIIFCFNSVLFFSSSFTLFSSFVKSSCVSFNESILTVIALSDKVALIGIEVNDTLFMFAPVIRLKLSFIVTVSPSPPFCIFLFFFIDLFFKLYFLYFFLERYPPFLCLCLFLYFFAL